MSLFKEMLSNLYSGVGSPEPEDNSEGVIYAREAQSKGISPQQLKLEKLIEANVAKKQELGYGLQQQQAYDKQLDASRGYTQYQQPEPEVSALAPEQRLDGYLKGTIQDPELAHDLKNSTSEIIEAKYGTRVADYSRRAREQEILDVSKATTNVPESEDTSTIDTTLAGGAYKAANNIKNTFYNAIALAATEGETEAEILRENNERNSIDNAI